MQRREFITLLGGAAAAWPLAARAQQGGRMRRIGALTDFSEDDPEIKARHAGFREGLERLGWSEGRNVRIDNRFVPTSRADSIRRPQESWSPCNPSWSSPMARRSLPRCSRRAARSRSPH